MEKKKNRKNRKKGEPKSHLKAMATAAALAGGLLISAPSAAKAAEVRGKGITIQQRVKIVRNALIKKLADSQSDENKLSYSERELAQWGNWPNWGNWSNWYNWADWNNWNNWGNWGNWRNF